MAQTYREILRQIAVLKSQAHELQEAEKRDVVAKIKEAIAVYGFTAEDLGLARTRGGAPRAGAAPGQPKFSDGAGNFWHGRGRRPQWLVDQLAAGRTLDDFLIAACQPAKPTSTPSTPSTRPSFTDGNGNTWTGMGPRPRWLKEAIAAGRPEAELRAN